MIVYMCRYPMQDQRLLRCLGCQIQAGIQVDHRQLAETTSNPIESLLSSVPPFVKEAWMRMK